MKEVQLAASIISHTDRPLETIYKSARQCYSAGSVADLEPTSREKMAELVQRCIRSGHTSVLEHVSFTFAISGVSRALSHQLVRHRVASYSQQSQRYVKFDEIEYVCPPSLRDETSAARAIFLDYLGRASHAYQAMVADGVPAEDARFVLPNATATNIVMTMNCRALLHFIEERSCRKAQWEIRNLAMKVMDCMVEELPEVFNFAGPKCRRLGYCPEEKGCGMYPEKGEPIMADFEKKEDAWNAIEDSEVGPMTYESRKYEKTPQKDRGRVLQRALEVITGERQQSYGDPEDSFEEIAWVWNWWLGERCSTPITSQDVAMMMCLMKLAREKNGAGKTDNVVDACGYLGLYEDMRGEEK